MCIRDSYTGAYILAGAPKIGKSFLVAQIAHHVSIGQELWGYKTHQGTVLYLALEDDESRLQRRMFRMFGVEGTSSLHFATNANMIGGGLDEQLEKFVREHSDIKERRSERANPESKRVKSKSVAGECGCISPLFVV